MYVYEKNGGKKGIWTVGFYTPDGQWTPESDHDNPGDAAARVNYLNGGPHAPANVKFAE